eukprot:gene44199-54942_t
MTAMQLNYIANASVPSASGRTIAMIDPSDGVVVGMTMTARTPRRLALM